MVIMIITTFVVGTMGWMNLEGGEAIGGAVVVMVVTANLLLFLHHLLVGRVKTTEKRNLHQEIIVGMKVMRKEEMIMMTITVEAVTHHTVLDHRVADQGAIRNIPTPPIRVLVLAPCQGQDQDQYQCLTRRHPRHLPLQDVMMDGSIAVMVTVVVVMGDEKIEAEVVVETEIIREKEKEEEGDHLMMGAAIRG
jgi:hypothetical protein